VVGKSSRGRPRARGGKCRALSEGPRTRGDSIARTDGTSQGTTDCPLCESHL